MKKARAETQVCFARIVLAVAACVMMTSFTISPGIAAEVHAVALVLREYRFEPATIQLKVGEQVELTIRNEGKSSHEWLIGRGLVKGPDGKGFQKDLYALLSPKESGSHYGRERAGLPSTAEPIPRVSSGLRIDPGGEVKLRFTVPASARGEWEMACLLSGHYETGMKGTLRID